MTANIPSDPDAAADDTARRVRAPEVHDHIVQLRARGERVPGSEPPR